MGEQDRNARSPTRLNTFMRLREFQSPKPQSPEQQRVNAMADRAKKMQQQVQQEKARQALAKAQSNLNKVNAKKSAG